MLSALAALGAGCAEPNTPSPAPVALSGEPQPAPGSYSPAVHEEAPPIAAFAVVDIPPPGAPTTSSYPAAFQREFTPSCGEELRSDAVVTPGALVRWTFDSEVGIADHGYDIYRICCGLVGDTPISHIPETPPVSFEKLNTGRVRPPQTHEEGLAFVNGTGTFPDGRPMLGSRMDAGTWPGLCHALQDATGYPEECPFVQVPPASELSVELEPNSLLAIASMRAEIAGVLGLYWVDHDLYEGQSSVNLFDPPECSYFVIGFWDQMTKAALAGNARLDQVHPPRGVDVTQTPPKGGVDCQAMGGPQNAYTGPMDATARLTWDLPSDPAGSAVATTPISYNICRASGTGTPGQINYDYYGDEKVETPIMVTRSPLYDAAGNEIVDPQGNPTGRPPAVFYEDAFPANGPPSDGSIWSYTVTGMDIFGRESKPSEPATLRYDDVVGPRAPVNVRASSEAVEPPGTPPRATVTLSWDWDALLAAASPDLQEFRVYRRWDTNALSKDGLGCQLGPHADNGWTQVGGPIPVSAVSVVLDETAPLPPAEAAQLQGRLPISRYTLSDELLLPTGATMRHAFYRIVGVDQAGNYGPPSGPGRGTVVDNRPALPPAEVKPMFSYSEWDDTVEVHLLWDAPSPNGPEVAGYKLLRSARRPSCQRSSDCPKICGDNGCRPMSCQSGFCGGIDNGPSGHRQEDRESMLTASVIPVQAGAVPAQLPKLQALAALDRLDVRGAMGGRPAPVRDRCLGSCCTVQNTAMCEDPQIVACVCQGDPYCCTDRWDSLCVQHVVDYGCADVCDAPPEPEVVCGDGVCSGDEGCEDCPADCGECFVASGCCVSQDGPGCPAPDVEACVCQVDPYCCTTRWDDICVNEVTSEGCSSCQQEPVPVCGDGTCDPSESCESCRTDCNEGCAYGTCPTPLQLNIDGATQYAQDKVPARAAGQVYFYRVMAVSESGITESDDPSTSTISASFAVQIPDYLAPPKPTLSSVLARPAPSTCSADEDALELTWQRVGGDNPIASNRGYMVLAAALDPANRTQFVVADSGQHHVGPIATPNHCVRYEVYPYSTLDDAGAAAPIASVVALADDPEGITLTWPVGDPSGQVVVRRTSGVLYGTGSQAAPVNPGQAVETMRSCEQPARSDIDYCYAVRVRDPAGHISANSDPVPGRRPDSIPPAAPHALQVSRDGQGRVRLDWTHPEDRLGVTIERSRKGTSGPWRTMVSRARFETVPTVDSLASSGHGYSAGHASGDPHAYAFVDEASVGRAEYWYRVVLHDAADNTSKPTHGLVHIGAE